jgi:hypothetical protein
VKQIADLRDNKNLRTQIIGKYNDTSSADKNNEEYIYPD